MPQTASTPADARLGAVLHLLIYLLPMAEYLVSARSPAWSAIVQHVCSYKNVWLRISSKCLTRHWRVTIREWQ